MASSTPNDGQEISPTVVAGGVSPCLGMRPRAEVDSGGWVSSPRRNLFGVGIAAAADGDHTSGAAAGQTVEAMFFSSCIGVPTRCYLPLHCINVRECQSK